MNPLTINSDQFNIAANTVKKINRNATDEELLELYSWYKQATIGDVNTTEPLFINFSENKKWNAWKDKKGNNIYTSEVAYINVVNKLIKKYGFQK
jgi:diazepam-binding inhibitor (GABA receptor modulating acyl-CoA-binding protein)